MKQWVFTFNEMLDFIEQNFKDYTLFLKGKLCQRHDKSYICGTNVMFPKDIKLIDRKTSIYKDNLYLLTDIDIYNHYIDFNSIGTKDELLKYLKKENRI